MTYTHTYSVTAHKNSCKSAPATCRVYVPPVFKTISVKELNKNFDAYVWKFIKLTSLRMASSSMENGDLYILTRNGSDYFYAKLSGYNYWEWGDGVGIYRRGDITSF